jgi:hypothetical protein
MLLFAAEHDKEGAREELMQGLKSWIVSDFHMERCAKPVVIPSNEALIILDD